MRTPIRTLTLFLALLVAASLACTFSVDLGGGGSPTPQAAAPTATPTEQPPAPPTPPPSPTPTPPPAQPTEPPAQPTEPPAQPTEPPAQPTEAPTPAPPPPTPMPPQPAPAVETMDFPSVQAGLSGLNSFRQTVKMTLSGGGKRGIIDYWAEFTTNPPATHGRVVLGGSAAAGLPNPSLEYIIIESRVWVKIGQRPWVRAKDVETATGQQTFSADDILFAVQGARRVMPNEVINGIECKHYIYDLSNIQQEGVTLDYATGDIYTAVDGGYVVRYTVNAQGSVEGLFGGQPGQITGVYDVFDVNAPISIQPPR